MFSIGFWEIMVVLAVAIIVCNPKDLPQIAHSIGIKLKQLKHNWEILKYSYQQSEFKDKIDNND